MKNFFLVAGLAAAIGFTACDDVDVSVLDGHQGAYILNKGTANSTISYYNYEDERCVNNYYQDKNNGSKIGVGATAMAVRKTSAFPKGIAFVTLPAENNIEMINMELFADASNIDDFTKPTDVVPSGEEVIYVSHNGGVSSYNIKSNAIVKTLEVADNPQKLISSGKYLYAACAGDGTGAKVFVIDMSNDAVVDEIDLVYDNPIDMVVDIDLNVWVYCSGDKQGIIKLKRTLINDEPFVEHEAFEFILGDNNGDKANPFTISRDGRVLYYVYDKLYSKAVYIEKGEDMTPDESIVTGDYQNEAFNGIDWDARTRRIMALTSGGKLVVLRSADDKWNDEEVYSVGENPIMTTFNF
jgi:hypothetical protein